MHADTGEMLRLLNMLALEGEVTEAYQGVGPDDTVVGYGPDGYDE